MKQLIKIVSLLFFIVGIIGCDSPLGNIEEGALNQEDTVSQENSISIKNYNGEDNMLFAFIGEKIALEPLPGSGPFLSENQYKAKYEIIEKVYGDFNSDTIEFLVYTHTGTPSFAKFKNVLLYTSADSGLYYHQKYLFNEIYPTKDGRWAGPYSVEDYNHSYNQNTAIKPRKIEFVKEISYQLDTTNYTEEDLVHLFPAPYFKIVGEKAITTYGNYPQELFKLKRDGYLTARGLFDRNEN